MASSAEFIVVSPIPPPMHGAAYAVQLLLGSDAADTFRLVHINARFVERIDELQKFTARKVLLLLGYLWQLVVRGSRRNVRAVILTPAFYPAPFLKDSLFILTAKFLLRKKVVAWFHMDFAAMRYDNLSGWLRRYVQFVLSHCDYYVCLGERLSAKYPEFMAREKVRIIPNGIPEMQRTERVAPEPQETTVLYVSNMAVAKGWRVLFSAAEAVCRQRPHVRFVFYGSPTADSSQAEIEQTFASSPLSSRIEFRGYVAGQAKEQAFASAQIFCFPSFHEAFPLTVLEAMSFGLPVVASDVGAVREAVQNDRGGYLVPAQDEHALVQALLQLIDNPAVCHSMGEWNRAAYEQGFTDKAYARRWAAFLHELEQT